MTRFEWFEAGYGSSGVELGLVSEARFAQYIRYKTFLEFKSEGHDKATAILYAADRCQCMESTIYRAISFFAETCENYSDEKT